MNKQREKFDKTYAIKVEIPVQWGDMDAFNHVNNSVYFKYFESARIAYFEQLGLLGNDIADNVAPILADTQCRYKFPLHYPDAVTVGARIIEQYTHGFLMEYAVYSQNLKCISSIGTGRIVMLNYATHKKVKVDKNILNKINNLEPDTYHL